MASLGLLAFAGVSMAQLSQEARQQRDVALQRLLVEAPKARILMEGGNIGRVYGPELGTGSNPANAYNSFIENYKDLFGPSDGNFVLVRELDVMRGKFKL
ncbi:MAG: hypothetical protein JNM04_03340, partial [Chthonomonas sp.]|nr:hypothetical protein [Chthonomonas sp.]